jgi:NhaP-type Na+/H+ or K+/H+ antiporter
MEHQSLTIGLAAIPIFGVCAQWLAAKLRIPSILALLGAGILAGPVSGLVKPDELFGPSLFPLVSLAVGMLLFEGGLSLRVSGFRQASSTVLRLVTVGAIVTWLVAAGAVAVLFDLSAEITLLLGAILVVSGPTVVIPLLRQARPQSHIAETLRWEGIVIDPIGAALAVVVLNVALGHEDTWSGIVFDLALTIGVGVAAGIATGALLTYLIVHFHVADNLLNPVAILFAVGAFTASNAVIGEAGLFATTTLGIVLANQRFASASPIAHFQEELGPLLLAGLFIVLGAQVDLGEVAAVALPSAALALVLVVIARPAVVWLSTVGSGMPWAQRAYLASLAPRGIVAASVASLFSLELERSGVEAGQLVPITFCVIFLTVLVASVGVVPLAQRLGVAMPPRNGLVLVGDQPWVLEFARAIGTIGVPTIVASTELVDDGDLPASVELFGDRVSSEAFLDALEQQGISDAIITVADPERAGYAAGRLVGALGRRHVFRMEKAPAASDDKGWTRSDHGRLPFGGLSLTELRALLREGFSFGPADVHDGQPFPSDVVPLISVDRSGSVRVETNGAVDGDDRQVIVIQRSLESITA